MIIHESDPMDGWILELHSKGKTGVEISKTTGLSTGAISRRLKKLRERAHESISVWASKTLPWEFERATKALEQVNREAWVISERAKDERTKLQALALAKDATAQRIDLLTHTVNIERVIQWASGALSKTRQATNTSQERSLCSNNKESGNAKGSTEDCITSAQ